MTNAEFLKTLYPKLSVAEHYRLSNIVSQMISAQDRLEYAAKSVFGEESASAAFSRGRDDYFDMWWELVGSDE